MEITRAFAILAPVSELYLLSGLEAIAAQLADDATAGQPKLALGSMAFETFRKADELRNGKLVEVLIYASDSQEDQPLNPEVSWRARYLAHVPSRNGRYPGKSMFRPKATTTERPTWAIYWEIQDLEKLKTPVAIASFQELGKKTPFKSRSVPDPVLIEYPFAAFVTQSRSAKG